MIRTRLSVCARKARYGSEAAALAAADQFGLPLRPYRCDRCRQIHLTGRTKGKRIARIATRTHGIDGEPDHPQG